MFNRASQSNDHSVRSLIVTLRLRLKFALRNTLETVGLLAPIQAIRRHAVSFISPKARHQSFIKRAQRRRMMIAKRHYADLMCGISGEIHPNAKRVLVVGVGPHRAKVEVCLVKALELAGCLSIPLGRSEFIHELCKTLPRTSVDLWKESHDIAAFYDRAAAVVCNCASATELFDIQFEGVRVGGHAISTARRKLKTGFLDLQTPFTRTTLIYSLADAMAATVAAKRIVREIRPTLVLTDDTAYTPRGPILEVCIEAKIPMIRWYPAHKSGVLMLKRYNATNRNQDIYSLSDASWRTILKMSWDNNRRTELKRELGACYSRGDWYGMAGTQFDKHLHDTETVRRKLRLDPSKKTAFIFSHIGWDASFGRGQDLFESYDEWLVETVRAACANDKLQWIVKIHPTHVIKSYYQQRPSEEVTINRCFDQLPPHVSILPAESDISTLSLFPVMDYCLTVRGTAGLEAACHGIPVLTGGTGRYDRKGFTIDSSTPEQYLARISHIQEIPRLTPDQIELAERYAYGLFLMRPFALSSVTMDYDRKYGEENFFCQVELKLRTRKDWEEAADLRAFTDWVLNSDEEDFLLPVPNVPADSIKCQLDRCEVLEA